MQDASALYHCQLCAKLFCRQLTKGYKAETSCKLDSATYLPRSIRPICMQLLHLLDLTVQHKVKMHCEYYYYFKLTFFMTHHIYTQYNLVAMVTGYHMPSEV